MNYEPESPAGLFREFGRHWSRDRHNKVAIENLRHATLALRSVLQGQRALISRIRLTLDELQKVQTHCTALSTAEQSARGPHALEKILQSRLSAFEHGRALASYANKYVREWHAHLAKIIPEVADTFGSDYSVRRSFEQLEHDYLHLQDAYSHNHHARLEPSIYACEQAYGALQQAFATAEETLDQIIAAVERLQAKPKGKEEQNAVFKLLYDAAPLFFATPRLIPAAQRHTHF